MHGALRRLLVAAPFALVAFVAGMQLRDVEASSVGGGVAFGTGSGGVVGASGPIALTGPVSITGPSGSTGLIVNAAGVNASAIWGVGIGTGVGAYLKGGSSNAAALRVENQAGASFLAVDITGTTSGWGARATTSTGRGFYGSATGSGAAIYGENSSTGAAVSANQSSTGTALTATNSGTGLAAIFTSDATSASQGTIRITPTDTDPTTCTVGDIAVVVTTLKICTATNTWTTVGSQ